MDVVIPSTMRAKYHLVVAVVMIAPKQQATQRAIDSVFDHDLTPARAMALDEPPVLAPATLPTSSFLIVVYQRAATPSSSYYFVPIVVFVFDCCV